MQIQRKYRYEKKITKFSYLFRLPQIQSHWDEWTIFDLQLLKIRLGIGFFEFDVVFDVPFHPFYGAE